MPEKWIKVETSLPDVGQKCIYYFRVTGVNCGIYTGMTDFGPQFAGEHGFLTGDVTHWMPMPDPPTPGD